MPHCTFATAFYNQNFKRIVVSTLEGQVFTLQL